jgi:hypothetical protein
MPVKLPRRWTRIREVDDLPYLRRPRCPTKLSTTAEASYKLMARAAALHHRETRAPTPTLNRSPEFTNFEFSPN